MRAVGVITTLVPVRGRHVGASGRSSRFSANVQLIVDADTRLMIATARPVPGATADAHTWRMSGLSEHCAGVTVLSADWTPVPMQLVEHRARRGCA